jgi:hypothetical protein
VSRHERSKLIEMAAETTSAPSDDGPTGLLPARFAAVIENTRSSCQSVSEGAVAARRGRPDLTFGPAGLLTLIVMVTRRPD